MRAIRAVKKREKMDKHTTEEIRTIGIIGGGRVGLELFELFSQSRIARVVYVADVNAAAPAIEAARKAGVQTYSRIDKALETPVDFILEVTGREDVDTAIRQQIAGTGSSLITHEMAFVILTVIGENNERVKTGVVQEINGIKGEISKSLHGIEQLVDHIDDITSQMNILSINARIEAARVGEQGKGFAVVASAMGQSAEQVKAVTRQIDQVSAGIEGAAVQIDVALNRLK